MNRVFRVGVVVVGAAGGKVSFTGENRVGKGGIGTMDTAGAGEMVWE